MINVIFMGRKAVASRCLAWLCGRQDCRVVAVTTDSHLEISPVRDVAQQFSIPMFGRNELEACVRSSALNADLCFSMLFWQRIRDPIISGCKRGVINFHPAPLPEYKGTAGYNIAILEALSDWAVSAHYVIDETIDTGPIIEVMPFPMDADYETAQSLERKAQGPLFDQFVRIADRAITSEQKLASFPNVGGKYVSRKQMEDMKEVVAGDDVHRKIRAFWFPPYRGAFITLDGEKFTILDDTILERLAPQESSSLFTKSVR